MADTGRRSANWYYRFPLADDATGTMTLLRLERMRRGRLLVHLHTCEDTSAFGVRFGYATPNYQPDPQPRRTIAIPPADDLDLSRPETVLIETGQFLADMTYGWGDGEIYPWYFEELLPNDEWLLHVQVLSAIHERLAPARDSGVFDDPRVQEVVDRVASGVAGHTEALATWLQRARQASEEVLQTAAREVHERKVRAVLRHLGAGLEENTRARPNPELPRIRTG